jgi:hypothetical protein
MKVETDMNLPIELMVDCRGRVKREGIEKTRTIASAVPVFSIPRSYRSNAIAVRARPATVFDQAFWRLAGSIVRFEPGEVLNAGSL